MLKMFSKCVIFFGLLFVGFVASADAGKAPNWVYGKKEVSQAGPDMPRREIMKQRRAERAATRENNKNAQPDRHEQNQDRNLDASKGPDPAVGKGRLTPEERRALRRQIREASNNLYVPPK
jgi:hypothetical protein